MHHWVGLGPWRYAPQRQLAECPSRVGRSSPRGLTNEDAMSNGGKMAERAVATVRIKQTEEGPAVALSIPGGTRLENILSDEALIASIRGLRGCETCTSGHPLYISEDYGEVVVVELS